MTLTSAWIVVLLIVTCTHAQLWWKTDCTCYYGCYLANTDNSHGTPKYSGDDIGESGQCTNENCFEEDPCAGDEPVGLCDDWCVDEYSSQYDTVMSVCQYLAIEGDEDYESYCDDFNCQEDSGLTCQSSTEIRSLKSRGMHNGTNSTQPPPTPYPLFFPKYEGCYRDSNIRDLPVQVFPRKAVTVGSCTAACYQAGYFYAGLQNGTECFCGNDFGSHGTSTHCTATCVGNNTETCGGSWANSVYWLLDRYQGCLGQALSPAFEAASGANITIESCQRDCAAHNYTYAGVQQSICWCGNSFNRSALVAQSTCSQNCSGDHSELCGNSGKYSVYDSWTKGTSYIGCFEYDTTLTPIVAQNTPAYTIEDCVGACKGNYSYAGLEAGGACYCVYGYSVLPPRLDSSCNVPCFDNMKEICGGKGILSIFSTSGYSASVENLRRNRSNVF